MTAAWMQELRIDLGLAEELCFNPYHARLDRGIGRNASLSTASVLDLASNNYLGLADDPRILEAAGNALRENGMSLCGTPIATGGNLLFDGLCRSLAEFVGLERALVYPSCYQANTGLFSSLVGKQDVVVVDQFAHSSLLQGIAAVGCKVLPFLHNDMGHLQRVLDRTRGYRRVLVASESVFSTRGTICPLEEMNRLALRYGALPVIDDSHGIGVLGRSGRGILEHAGLEGFTGIYTASLGKALAGQGGVVAGSASLMEYLSYANASYIYSTALVPPVLGGLSESLRIVEEEFQVRRDRLIANRELLIRAAEASGIVVVAGEAPIVSVRTGSDRATLAFAKVLLAEGVFSTPFLPPSVPPNQGVVRLIPNAALTDEDMRTACRAMERAADATSEIRR
ncbi:MAG: pyridoxal phosphate-dependent aminotransferase family protein [Fibrobacteria bacterium]|nr:pyridoxal phosphate-dependent aminotransferase family protein [Fibrobacteria bacterium]